MEIPNVMKFKVLNDSKRPPNIAVQDRVGQGPLAPFPPKNRA